MKAIIIIVVMLAAGCLGQRGSFAGSGFGYPKIDTSQPADSIANRFGDDVVSTTMRLPAEVRGDVALYNRLRKLPVDHQPFWFINWQAVEANRDNPKNYPQKQSDFIDNNVNIVRS